MSWEKVKLSEITEYITDGDHQPAPKSDSGVLFIKIKDIQNNQVSFDNALFVPQEYYDRLPVNRKAVSGDTLYTVVGSYGIPAFVKHNTPFCFERNIALLHPNSMVIPKYLYYAVKNPVFYEYAHNIANGSAQKLIPLSKLGDMEISLPPLDLQQKIVAYLSAYDDLIENNQKQIKLLEEAAQRLYKEWFVELRFPGYENTPIVDGVPEGWRQVCLDDIISKITTGLNPRKNFVLGNGKNYYVTIKNMANNSIYLNDKCDRIDDEAIEKINSRSDLQLGDILFSGIGTIGRVYMIDIPTTNWNVSESVFTIRASDLVSKEYLYLLLLSNSMQSYCDQNAHGAAQRGIRMADLRAYKFYLPIKNLIDLFTLAVKPLINKTQYLRQQITLLEEARDRLLPKLMNGEIEV